MQTAHKTLKRTFGGLLLATGLALASPAFAEGSLSALPVQTAAEPSNRAGDEVLSAEELGDLAGGTGVDGSVITSQTLTAINSGNTVTGESVTSGQINLSAGAFSDFNGVGNFVINTGHNNNLQSSLNVSILLGP